MVKTYVLDTNILLADSDAIEGFEENEVAVTMTTLQELDGKKNVPGEIGYQAREAIRTIERLSKEGSITAGIPLSNGGTFRVICEGVSGIHQKELPLSLNKDKADNQIISICKALLEKNNNVVLVTNDVSMRIIAGTVLGQEHVESYRNSRIKSDYKGHIDIELPIDAISEIYRNRKIGYVQEDIYENEFVTVHTGTSSALTVYRNGELLLIPNDIKLYGKVTPKNSMQRYAAWALSQPASELPLVIMSGPAGTAKTYLSLAAGLDKTISDKKYFKNEYYKMLISRPNSEAGDNGFGYLPGSLEEKMEPLLLPYYDNLEALLADEDNDRMNVKMQIEDLFESGVIEVCALSYIRGRTLPNSYIVCDEAQNAQRQLLKDVITRAGEGSKVIIAGDPTQCDNPQLDHRNNGLTYAIESWKGSKNAAIITFEERNSVRSELAREALERMK